MDKYSPPYRISDQMLMLVAAISEKLGRLRSLRSLEAKVHLRRNNKIQSIHSSLRIEANSLSLGEVRDVIDGRLVLGPAQEIQEVKNAYDAYEALSSVDPYRMEELKRLHSIMMRGMVSDAGSFRQGEEGVFHGDRCIFMAPPARLVPGLMRDLFEWMASSRETVHPLILSAVFHYEFVFIHPFSDGNGRMARLWHSALLTKWDSFFEYVPLESQIERFQEDYYQAISCCHLDGESTKFILFMLERINEILDHLSAQRNTVDEHCSQYVKRLLENMEYDVPYTAGELLSLLHLKSRESLRRNYLVPALKQKLIEMTIPDKPRSRNQRYIKKY